MLTVVRETRSQERAFTRRFLAGPFESRQITPGKNRTHACDRQRYSLFRPGG